MNMIIIGHRGAKGLAPENTLASIKAGIKAGAKWIEIDVRTTSDGHVVVIHDATTARVASKMLVVAHTTLDSLKAARVQGEQIPTLSEVIALTKNKAVLNIEIKAFGCIPEVVRQTRLAGYQNIVVSSFSRNIVEKVQAQDPKIRCALLQAFNPFAFKTIKGLYAVGFHHLFAPRSAIALAKKQGLLTYVYTVNDPARVESLKARGIDALVTDFPDTFA